ncbi:MAG TPA: M23 family metallopeptidase [Alphaproteobacteria bacterium]
MRRLFRVAAMVAAATVWAQAAVAAALELHGRPIQGGLMRGHVAPGCVVTLDSAEVRVADDGEFVIGFGHDHGEWSIVKALCEHGPSARRFLRIEQRSYPEQRIDGLPEAMVTFDEETLARIRTDQARVDAARAADSDLAGHRAALLWPATGPITGTFGARRVLNGEPRQPHFGIDIEAAPGTSVRAAAAGRVTLAEELYLSGKTVILDHGHGLGTSYLHLGEIAVAVGEEVAQGDVLGTVGMSGRATGAHLDWRITWYRARLDPALLAGPMPGQ